jgi:broad specificity phosphatase PhoE
MEKSIYLFLIRHGQSETNASKHPQKNLLFPDPNLTALGILQAQADEKFFESKKPLKVYTSVLIRAQETALIIFPRAKINVVDSLKEVSNEKCFGSNFPLANRNLQWQKMATVGISHQRLVYQKALFLASGNYKQSISCTSGNIMTFLQQHQDQFENNDNIVLVVHANLIQEFLNTKETIPNASIIQVYNSPDKTMKTPFYLGPLHYFFLTTKVSKGVVTE